MVWASTTSFFINPITKNFCHSVPFFIAFSKSDKSSQTNLRSVLTFMVSFIVILPETKSRQWWHRQQHLVPEGPAMGGQSNWAHHGPGYLKKLLINCAWSTICRFCWFSIFWAKSEFVIWRFTTAKSPI